MKEIVVNLVFNGDCIHAYDTFYPPIVGDKIFIRYEIYIVKTRQLDVDNIREIICEIEQI